MIILDTNVVSELIRATPDPGVRAWVNSLPSTQIATTAITAAELYYGIARLPAGQRRQQLAVARQRPAERCAAGPGSGL